MTTVRRQGEIIQIHDNNYSALVKTFRRQNIALDIWKIVKQCLNVAQKAKKCSNSVQKSRNSKIV